MLTAKDFYLNCVDLFLSQFGINLEENSKHYHIWIAYSGGVDSRVLLELTNLAFKTKLNLKLTAVHINHGINPNAFAWEKHCDATCKNLNIKLHIEKLQVSDSDVKQFGLEAALRESRLAIWHKLLLPGDILFLAHHLNDQAETVFLRLLRGTGVLGLGGIKMAYALNNIKYMRPLLNNTKDEILSFAKQHQLNYIEDDSNLDLKFSRNFLRHVILPEFYLYWPRFLYNINRAACHLQQTDLYINNQVNHALLDCYAYDMFNITNNIANKHILSISKLLSKEKFLQPHILRRFMIDQKSPPPTQDQIERIYKEIINTKIDAKPKLKCGRYLILKYRDKLYIYLEKNFIQEQNNVHKIKNTIGNLTLIRGHYSYQEFNEINFYKAKKIFQKNAIPPWYRKFYSLVFFDNRLIAIIGLWNRGL